MQKTVTSIVFLLISICTYSQNFETGQIIKNGKKIQGFIQYENWLKSPQNIQFKSSLNDTTQIVNANDGTKFMVHGEVYISKKISISVHSDSPTSMNTPVESSKIDGFYFLRVLIEGQSINLYEMVDKVEGIHLFVEKNDLFQELIYTKEYVYDKNEVLFVQEKKKYIGQLRSLFSDCEVLKVPDNTLYTTNGVLKLCLSYKKCKGEESVSLSNGNQNDKINISLGMIGATFLNNFDKPNGLVGLSLRLNFPRNYRNSYVLLEGNYYLFTTDSKKYFTTKIAGANLLIGTHFGKGDIRPFFNPGIALFNDSDSKASAILGAGLSYKKSLKIEFRRYFFTNDLVGLNQLSFGYMYNF